MAKRSKWFIQNRITAFKTIRDSEFQETIANLGKLIYDEICSLPVTIKSNDLSIVTTPVFIADGNKIKGSYT